MPNKNIFNIYKSGGSTSLPSKEEMKGWIEACDVRYHDHLALGEKYEKAILVMWTNEKDKSP